MYAVYLFRECIETFSSPNKRSFRGLAVLVGTRFRYGAKICARELASVVSRGLQGASRGLQLTTGRTIYIYIYI